MLDEVVSAEVVQHFCCIASRRLGVDIGAGQQALVAGRVAKRLQLLQLGLDEYLDRLNDDDECSEVVGFLDLLRPRPPRFFARREDHVVLHATVRRCLDRGQRRIRLWSAGCGTGEEAYGMVLTALSAVHVAEIALSEVDIKVLATDISKTILERGKLGVFSDEQLRDVPPTLYDRFFHPTDDGMAIDDDIKDMVSFRRLNLTNLPYPMTGPLEAIFCHEALAPLSGPARKRAAGAAKALLADHGVLCTGFADELLAETGDDAGAAVVDAAAAAGLPPPRGHC